MDDADGQGGQEHTETKSEEAKESVGGPNDTVAVAIKVGDMALHCRHAFGVLEVVLTVSIRLA